MPVVDNTSKRDIPYKANNNKTVENNPVKSPFSSTSCQEPTVHEPRNNMFLSTDPPFTIHADVFCLCFATCVHTCQPPTHQVPTHPLRVVGYPLKNTYKQFYSISVYYCMYLSPCLSVVLQLGHLCILVTPISTHHFLARSKLSLALGGSILCLFLGSTNANPAKQHGNIKMSCT